MLCLSHSIEEFDQLRLLHGLGYGVFSLGGYIDPAHPHDPKRPALPEVPHLADLHAAVDAEPREDNIGAAQANIPDAILDWLGDDGAIIFHHRLDRLFGQWADLRRRFRGRIIWRTVGQSVEGNERDAAHYRAQGLEIVRYSPKERNIPGYVGEDALIRFYKDPAEWHGWTGEDQTVIQFVQSFGRRDVWCNRPFFEAATDGLPRRVYGPESEGLEYGHGTLSPADMLDALQRSRAYLYTGTQPASYTLGLIEAMMVGIPVVSIGPEYMTIFPYGPDLFEGHEIAGISAGLRVEGLRSAADQVAGTRDILRQLLAEPDHVTSAWTRKRAIELFGRDTIAAQWKAYLG